MRRVERDLRRLAYEYGWELSRRPRAGHYRLRDPITGAIVIASSTPGTIGELRLLKGLLIRAERQNKGDRHGDV